MGALSFEIALSSLSLRRKPRLTGPLFKKEPTAIGPRLTLCDPGGPDSAEPVLDLAIVMEPYCAPVSWLWYSEVLRLILPMRSWLLFESTADPVPCLDVGLLFVDVFRPCPS